MWIVAIAWMYVAVLMTLAEATSANGTVLGAIITFVFYGLAPVALVMYLLGTPARRRARLQKGMAVQEEAQRRQMASAEADSTATAQPDAGSLTAGDAVSSERKEP